MPTLPSFPVDGGCICGATRYRLSAPPLGVYNCHCKDCQRSAGSPFTASMIVSRIALAMIAGETQVYDKIADSGRIVRHHSCPVCSTRIFNEPLSSPDILVVRPGTLDDSSWAVPVGNIWTESRAPWVEIDWSAPHFAGQAPSREPLYAAWRAYFGTAG